MKRPRREGRSTAQSGSFLYFEKLYQGVGAVGKEINNVNSVLHLYDVQ